MLIDPSELDKLIRIEAPVAGKGFTDAGSGTWMPVAKVWASIKDSLPSRGERLADGINVAARPARVRMFYRNDLDASMRFVFGGRVMQIIAGPAEIGVQEGLEFMVEEYRPAGNAA
jgi:head-tail adaptor